MPSLPRVVVDASALLERLLRSRRGDAVTQAVGDSRMLAPGHIDVEVLNALRGLVRSSNVAAARAEAVVEDLRAAPLERIPTRELGLLIWARRENLSAYDAGYAVLADVLECPLVTADARLKWALARLDTVVVAV